MNFRVKEFINTLKLGNYKGLFLLITLVFFVIETYAQTKDIEYKTTAKTKEDIRNKIEFSTLDYESGLYTVKVSTTGSNSKYIARLKYRVDNQKWNDLLDSRGRRIEHANYKRKNSSTYKVLLDKDLLDKKKVEIGWEVILIRKRGRLPVFRQPANQRRTRTGHHLRVFWTQCRFRRPLHTGTRLLSSSPQGL